MIRRMRNVFSCILAVVLLLNCMDMKVFAAEFPEENAEDVEVLEAIIERFEPEFDIMPITRISDATISVSRSDKGMEIFITTMTNEVSSVIGVKDIKVKHKVWWGWDTVATSTGGCVYDASAMSCTLYYAGAIQGDSYKISCVHYADVDGYHELPSETTDFIYNF